LKLLVEFVTTFIAVVAVRAVFAPVGLLPNGDYTSIAIFAGVLALLNLLVRPIVHFITCPIQILTLGLARLAINGAFFLLAATFARQIGATVTGPSGFVNAVIGALLVSVASALIAWVLRR
jgi:putative membrane protein